MVKKGGKKANGELIALTENLNTLSDWINKEPTEEDYYEYIDLVTDAIQKKYEMYDFQLATDVTDNVFDTYKLIFTFNPVKDEAFHKMMVKFCMDKGIDYREIHEYFVDVLSEGNVIPFGYDDTLEIEPDRGYTRIDTFEKDSEVRAIIGFSDKALREKREKARKEFGIE